MNESEKKMNESEIRNKILAACCAYGGLWYRRNVGQGVSATGVWVKFGLPGQADINGCLHGKFIEIEVKAKKGKQYDAQKKWQAAVEKAGGIYILADNVDTVISRLDQICKHPKQPD